MNILDAIREEEAESLYKDIKRLEEEASYLIESNQFEKLADNISQRKVLEKQLENI